MSGEKTAKMHIIKSKRSISISIYYYFLFRLFTQDNLLEISDKLTVPKMDHVYRYSGPNL